LALVLEDEDEDASAVVIHYEEALYQVYAPLPLPFTH